MEFENINSDKKIVTNYLGLTRAVRL